MQEVCKAKTKLGFAPALYASHCKYLQGVTVMHKESMHYYGVNVLGKPYNLYGNAIYRVVSDDWESL